MTEGAPTEELRKLLCILQKHRWPKVCRRLNIVAPEYRHKGGKSQKEKYTLCETKSQAFSKYNKRMHGLYEMIRQLLPPDFPQLEHLTFTINKNVCCYPHVDSHNLNEILVMFLGDFTGGALCLENGQRFTEKYVWHRYRGGEILHWNEAHSGDKFSVIAHNNSRSICWGIRKGIEGGEPSIVRKDDQHQE
ncbi:MAG: hypothetical protein EBZ48_16095 [Proteobacteria bacterium]|nr:hypothetical protein [Pseudomonadota bacterium]